MEYRRFDDKIVARIDKGEEIVEKLALICEKEGVKLGYITAIGAVNRFTAGVFSPAEKTYASREFGGDFEIVSLTGTYLPCIPLKTSETNIGCDRYF